MATKEERRQARLQEENVEKMLWALARAHNDSSRPTIRTLGIDERDLAFESGILSPAEVETTTYATQKRGRILRLLREMQGREWVRFEAVPPHGAYHVFLLPAGAEKANRLVRSWWSKLWEQVRDKLPHPNPTQGGS